MEVCCIFTNEVGIMKPIKDYESGWRERREWKYNGRGKLVQSTLSACTELSQ
jgi:hypothetical protein